MGFGRPFDRIESVRTEVVARRVADQDSLWAGADVSVGVAVDPRLIAADEAYVTTLAREFNAITPENAMKWGIVHPTELGWNFGPADQLVAFAAAHDMRVHGHALVWHRQLPDWVADTLPPRRLARALEYHITELVGRYCGRVGSWDVVNEAVSDRARLRDTRFLRTLGSLYIADAFRLTHAADPSARLYYNDYGAEGCGTKADAVYGLLRHLLDQGVLIHGVGFQMHLDAASHPTPDEVTANVERLVHLGLDVRISEMDVRIRNVRRGDPFVRQRAVYHDMIAACLRTSRCAGVTFWGLADAHSWIDARFGDDDPLLFDEAYARKPAYLGVREALTGRSTSRSPV